MHLAPHSPQEELEAAGEEDEEDFMGVRGASRGLHGGDEDDYGTRGLNMDGSLSKSEDFFDCLRGSSEEAASELALKANPTAVTVYAPVTTSDG